jgi:ABC-2 type transport system permease protein
VTRRRALIAHELRTQLRSAPFAVVLLMLIGAASTLNPVAMIKGGGDATLPVRAFANSVYALAPTFAMSAFFVYPFFVALMAGLSVRRDEECGIAELVHSTPVSLAEYFWCKFAGVLLALLGAITVHLLVVMAFREIAVGGVVRGPFHAMSYLLPVLWFVVPGVVWTAGLTFAIGARTKSPMAVYVAPIALYALEFFLLWNWHPRGIDPTLDAVLMIVDPTGLRWLTHSLFAADHDIAWYNTAAFAFDGVAVLGRIVTLLVPAAAVAWLARRRPQRADARGVALGDRWRRLVRTGKALAARTQSPTQRRAATIASMDMRPPGALRATATVWSAECRNLVRQPSVYLFVALLAAVVLEVSGTEVDAYGSRALLTAGGMAIQALPVVTVLTCLFLLFVVVESLYRDRLTGFDVIALSSPVPTASFIAGKALGAGMLVALITLVCVVSSGTLLLAQSGASASWWPLLLIFGGVLIPTYVLWVAFVTAVSTVARARATALAVGFMALLLTAAQFIRGAMTWLTNWPLWGALRWTEFALFPLDGEALLLNRLLALGMALALLVGARYLYQRTERDPIAARGRRSAQSRRQRASRFILRAAPLIVLPLFTGTFLAIRVQNAYDAPRVTRQAVMPAPPLPNARIDHVDASIKVLPSQRRLIVNGAYDLVNRTNEPLATLPFTVPPSFGPVSWHVDGAPLYPTRTAGRVALPLAQALLPGARVRVSFAYEAQINAGISRNGGAVDAFVLPAGVLLSTHRGDFLPVPGHHGAASIEFRPTSNSTSEPASASAQSPADDETDAFNQGWSFTSVMRVDAPRAMLMNGVGERTASAVMGDRALSVWESRIPIAALSLIGASYSVRRAEGVAVFHHPAHTQRIDEITTTLAAARRRYAQWFFPYPWSELRLSEYADLSTQATSYPTNIAFSEGLGFLTTNGADGGLAFAVTAHEAAHQWWGHILAADHSPGSGLLIEGMADFSTLLLYESERGANARRGYARVLEQQYLEARSAVQERPLLETREETSAHAAVLQKKGAWAIWMLYQQLGSERMFPALRAFITAHRTSRQFANTTQLLNTLRTHAADTVAFDAVVSQWFRGVGLPAFSVHDVHCSAPSDKATWQCTARIHNDGTSGATVDVATVVSDRPIANGVQQVHIEPGERRQLTWRIAQRPDRIVVDPDIQLLQAGRERATMAVPR